MIYIEKGDKVALPQKYHAVNNLCAIIYDQLVEIFEGKGYAPLRKMNFKFNSDQLQVDELKNHRIEPLEWMEINGLKEELVVVVSRNVVMAIVSDLVNFVYESMMCAKKGKITIAYALLRKPFTDELLILEQLLDNRDDFVRRFYYGGDSAHYDPSNKKLNKKEIIQKAIDQVGLSAMFSSDLLYNLRYDKQFPGGLNAKTNHALHIVTNDKNYRTAARGLNFVFSAAEDYEELCEHYYLFIPYLLNYTVCLVDEIIFKHLPEDKKTKRLKNLKKFKRLIAFLMWANYSSLGKGKSDEIYSRLSKHIKLHCYECNSDLELVEADFKLFFEIDTFLCPNCFSNTLSNRRAVNAMYNGISSLFSESN